MDSYMSTPSLDNLPDLVFEKILLMLSYHEIAQLREVNKKFNMTCMALLNRGHASVKSYHKRFLKSIKTRLPTKKNIATNNEFSRHYDILSAVETRISMINIIFLKHIEKGLCCFIPGKVIDEMNSVLQRLKWEKNPPKTFQLLREFIDLSSMAMDYFKENTLPSLKRLQTKVDKPIIQVNYSQKPLQTQFESNSYPKIFSDNSTTIDILQNSKSLPSEAAIIVNKLNKQIKANKNYNKQTQKKNSRVGKKNNFPKQHHQSTKQKI